MFIGHRALPNIANSLPVDNQLSIPTLPEAVVGKDWRRGLVVLTLTALALTGCGDKGVNRTAGPASNNPSAATATGYRAGGSNLQSPAATTEPTVTETSEPVEATTESDPNEKEEDGEIDLATAWNLSEEQLAELGYIEYLEDATPEQARAAIEKALNNYFLYGLNPTATGGNLSYERDFVTEVVEASEPILKQITGYNYYVPTEGTADGLREVKEMITRHAWVNFRQGNDEYRAVFTVADEIVEVKKSRDGGMIITISAKLADNRRGDGPKFNQQGTMTALYKQSDGDKGVDLSVAMDDRSSFFTTNQ